jgi:hypothetical protein
MCTVTLNIDEALARKVNPALTSMEAITSWAQQLVDKRIADLLEIRSRENLTPYTIEELHARIDQSLRDSAAGLGQESEEMFREMEEEFALEEERAYWAQSVERDLTDIAEGKTAEYMSGDEFWSRFEQAAMKQYENVPA